MANSFTNCCTDAARDYDRQTLDLQYGRKQPAGEVCISTRPVGKPTRELLIVSPAWDF